MQDNRFPFQIPEYGIDETIEKHESEFFVSVTSGHDNNFAVKVYPADKDPVEKELIRCHSLSDIDDAQAEVYSTLLAAIIEKHNICIVYEI